MIPTLLLNIHRPDGKVAQILRRSNGTFFYRGLWFTNTSFLATSDPENVHYILSSNSSVYLKGSEWLKHFDIFGEALFNSDGEASKRHGKAFHAFFNHPQIRQSLSKVLHQRIEEALVEVLEYVCRREIVVNLQDLFARHAFDIGCIMGMGFNPGSDRPTLKDSLMRDNIIQFLFGSEGTYGLTREEIKRHLSMKQMEGGLHIPSNYDELSKLTYLHAAVCETLRLYPLVPFEFRSCTKPDFLPSGHRVDRSTRVLIGIHAMGRMESLWGEDCYELKPERWIRKEVSFLVMKATVAAIMHSYNVDVLEGQNISSKNSVLCKMKKGLMVGVKKRWS
ncbi:hypothetical protein Gorai_008733 [Gossypium raimondii]|uniref:Cytochrome P450 n=1 Tax=Gossypium raimondii TaxID=29730 RepID=A0A7J8PR23_GOSRA|nr:hypothetical protein [Gossypium raimondii]